MRNLITQPQLFRCLSVALALCLTAAAGAQTAGFALSHSGVLEPEVQLRDLETGPATLDLRLAGGVREPLEAGAAARWRSLFGPLGTVAVSGHADASTAGAFELGVGGSGALAATGLDASLSVFNRNPGAFAPTAAYALASRPFFRPLVRPFVLGGAGVGAHLELSATQRLGRTLILEATPTLSYLAGTGFGAGFVGRLQLRRLVESDNGVALLEAGTGPGPGRSFIAAGAEYQLNRQGLPVLTGALLLGSSEAGMRPGLRAGAAGELSRFTYRAELAAEPYRPTAPPYRANLAVGTALGPGALVLELGAALENDFGVPLVLVRSSYAFRF
jgi:hypothetical protein